MIPEDPALANGFYITPTIMDNVTDDMVIAREEVFGPVATIMTFDTEEEVVAWAIEWLKKREERTEKEKRAEEEEKRAEESEMEKSEHRTHRHVG